MRLYPYYIKTTLSEIGAITIYIEGEMAEDLENGGEKHFEM